MEEYKKNECFICFEVSSEYEYYPSRLNSQLYFFKICNCDGWIHENCIETWYNIHGSCPICRTEMINIYFEFHYILYIINKFFIIINFIQNFIQKIIKLRNIIIFCIILTNIMNILIYFNKFEKTEYKYVNKYFNKYNYNVSKYNYNVCYLEDIYTAPQIL